MATQKENIIQMIKKLPDDISLEDIIEVIYVRQKIEKGLKDSKEGNLYTNEEAKELLEKWLKLNQWTDFYLIKKKYHIPFYP